MLKIVPLEGGGESKSKKILGGGYPSQLFTLANVWLKDDIRVYHFMGLETMAGDLKEYRVFNNTTYMSHFLQVWLYVIDPKMKRSPFYEKITR